MHPWPCCRALCGKRNRWSFRLTLCRTESFTCEPNPCHSCCLLLHLSWRKSSPFHWHPVNKRHCKHLVCHSIDQLGECSHHAVRGNSNTKGWRVFCSGFLLQGLNSLGWKIEVSETVVLYSTQAISTTVHKELWSSVWSELLCAVHPEQILNPDYGPSSNPTRLCFPFHISFFSSDCPEPGRRLKACFWSVRTCSS